MAVRGGGTRVFPLDDPADDRPGGAGHGNGRPGGGAAVRVGRVRATARTTPRRRIAAALGIVPRSRCGSTARRSTPTVADGRADVYLRLPTKKGYVERIWDHAGGALVVEEAGGTVTDVDGRPLDFTRGRGLESNRGVVVTNGCLHAAVLAAVRAAGA